MRFFLTLIAVLIADQLSKYVIVTTFAPGEKYSVIGDFFTLICIYNKGAAFGILEGKLWFFIVAALLVVGGIIYYTLKYSLPPILQYALGLIAGGALGNLVDRIFYRSVIDFISIGWWPVFNLADVGITVGSAVLICFVIYKERKDGVENG